jgi:hypothetical protein
MTDKAPKKFRLSFVNAAEDVPRLVRAYGRACQGEFALVLRPPDQSGLLALVTKEGATFWRPSTSGGTDAPDTPSRPIEAKDAVRLIKAEQQAVRKPGPITLKGQWSGYLHCDGGAPRVELVRKLAAYGVLTISSSPEGWSWSVARTEKWFSKPGADTGSALTLLKAIEGGLARAMGLLGEACSVRDSHRRAALDTSFAADHPIKPAHEGKDPTERLRPKEPRKTKARAPAPMDAPVSLPDVPVTAPALHRMAEEVTAEADALEAVRGLAWVWQESSAKEDAVAWFSQVGLDELAEQVAAYDGGPDRPLDTFVAGLRELVAELDVDEPTRQDALVQITRLHDGWKTAPALLERARRLVRYAARMSESKLCRGRERKEAGDAVDRAVRAYTEARDAIGRGEPFDGVRKLRSIAQWVALAAAKAAKACSAGQMSLPSGSSSVADEGLQPGDRAVLVSDPSRVGTVLEWRGEDRVAWREDGQRVTALLRVTMLAPVVDEVPAKAPKAAAPKKERKPRAQAAPTRVPQAAPVEVDAAKDKALIDAFSAAVAAAIG